jgi:hypothetical protein
MRGHPDATRLSAFIDGELDEIGMLEVDQLMDSDEQARDYALKCLRKTALLKSRLNAVMHEAVPERLVNTVHRHRLAGEQRRRMTAGWYRLAAAIILVLVGYGAAFFAGNGGTNGPLEIAPLLSRYGHVLDAALENNLSGTPGKWQEPGESVTITVTPVKTYRDAGNQYYREYRLRISSSAGRQDVGGLAYRTGGGKWKTKMLIF